MFLMCLRDSRKSTEYLLKQLQIAVFSDGDKLRSVRGGTEYLSVIQTDFTFHQLRHVVSGIYSPTYHRKCLGSTVCDLWSTKRQ